MIVRPADIGDAERAALAGGTLLAERADVARFELTGTQRVACLQGIVTCDVARSTGGSLFGALLTNKGMIVAPLWIALLDGAIRLEAPAAAAPALAETFARTLPPRLCRWRDVTAETASLGFYGPGAAAAARPAGAWPARARGLAGWETQPAVGEADALVERALSAGAVRASAALLERSRIEAGVPRLGLEIDDRTLPQEARLDALDGVSYSKGCYVGQETVARVHFRGHANRRLVSVDLAAEPDAVPFDLAQDEKAAGRLTSAAWSEAARGWIGLAVVRRGVDDGAELDGAGLVITVRGERWLRPA